MRPLRLIAASASVLLGTAFVGHSLMSLVRHHLTVLHKDQWRIYYDYFDLPFLEAITKPQNRHFKILPALLYFTDIHLFSATNTFLVIVGDAFAIATAFMFTLFIVREGQLTAWSKAILSTFVWVVMFWLASFVALGWGNVAVNIYLITFLLAVSIAVLMKGQTLWRCGRHPAAWWSLAAAGGLALLATFSFGAGIVVLPTLVFCALALRLPARMTLLLSTATVATGGLLLAISPKRALGGESHLAPLTSLRNLGEWLGSPWFHVTKGTKLVEHRDLVIGWVAPTLGLLLLGAALAVGLICLRRARKASRSEVFFAAVALFGVGVALLGVVVRGENSKQWPHFFMGNRYMPWSLMTWIALCCAFVLLAQRRKRRLAIVQALLLPALGLAPILLWPSHSSYLGAYVRADLRDQEAALGLLAGVQDRELVARQLFEEPDKVFRVAEHLRRRNLNIFDRGWHHWMGKPAGDLFVESHAESCKGGVTRVRPFPDQEGESARVFGWADVDGSSSPEAVVIVDPDGVITGLAGFTRGQLPRRARTRTTTPLPGFFGYIRGIQEGVDYRLFVVLEGGERVCDLGTAI